MATKKQSRPRPKAGRAAGKRAAPRAPTTPPVPPAKDSAKQDDEKPIGERFSRSFAPPELYDEDKRKAWGLGEKPDDLGPYIIELNLQHIEGLSGARVALKELHGRLRADPRRPEPVNISKTYVRCDLTAWDWQQLLALDGAQAETRTQEAAADRKTTVNQMRFRAIYKLWPDFPVRGHIYRSMPTIKADAALRSYDAGGDGIVWAVIDSGIHGAHAHFNAPGYFTLDAIEVRELHRSFVGSRTTVNGISVVAPLEDPDDAETTSERQACIDRHREQALTDEFGHGTHVAGVIAGTAPPDGLCALERVDRVDESGTPMRGQYDVAGSIDPARLRGVAPRCRIVSLKVLDANGDGRSSDVIRALDYVRERLNDNPKLLRVHGVNLSVGYEFDAEMFACGQSPLCAEVNRLVQSGVVVVTAAGNTGYGTVGASVRPTKVGLSNTINDPGNAEHALTVGATHRDAPYTYGVSYFSSKGPTGDGRLKPDLVAPGERITSCGAGKRLDEAKRSANSKKAAAYYLEDSGTSMAAPHVSGAVAAFLSIRREFIGRPLEVKRIFCSTATPLGRERYFEGNGLVDLIRAIQSV